jgi:hypothetical protein
MTMTAARVVPGAPILMAQPSMEHRVILKSITDNPGMSVGQIVQLWSPAWTMHSMQFILDCMVDNGLIKTASSRSVPRYYAAQATLPAQAGPSYLSSACHPTARIPQTSTATINAVGAGRAAGRVPVNVLHETVEGVGR